MLTNTLFLIQQIIIIVYSHWDMPIKQNKELGTICKTWPKKKEKEKRKKREREKRGKLDEQ